MGREKAARGSVSTPPGAGAAQTTSDRGAASSRPEGAEIIPFKRPAASAARHASLPKNRRVTATASSPARDDSDRAPSSSRASRALRASSARKRSGNVVLMFFGLAAVATVIFVLSQRGQAAKNAAPEATETTTKSDAPKPREVPAPRPVEPTPTTMVTVGVAPPIATEPPAPTPTAPPAATVAPKPTAAATTSPAEKPIAAAKPATDKAPQPATTVKPATDKAPPPKPAPTPKPTNPEDIY